MPTVLEALRDFAEAPTANVAVAELNPAQAEDQLKESSQRLLARSGESIGLDVVPRTEARRDLGVRLDLGVSVNRLLAGHVELKAPGKRARARAFTGHDREQFKALADHPNLLYSDGNEWALYRHGQLVGDVIRAEGDVTADGPDAYFEPSGLALEGLLRDFLGWEPLVPSSPRALAELLAPLNAPAAREGQDAAERSRVGAAPACRRVARRLLPGCRRRALRGRVRADADLRPASLLTNVLGEGPAASVTHLIPDLHHFRGSFGAKDAIPLWRDAACTEPNVTAGLLLGLAERFGEAVEPMDLLVYVYALLSAPSYTERFAAELAIPGPRVALTRDARLFGEAVELGERLIWLHTFGERLVPESAEPGEVPSGVARCTHAVGATPETYPADAVYDEERQELRVGDGVFPPVTAAVWRYSISGLDVLPSWLKYRLRDGRGRRSSPLDEIRPTVWPAAFTEELRDLDPRAHDRDAAGARRSSRPDRRGSRRPR